MVYTQEQLHEFADNLELLGGLTSVLEALNEEENLTVTEIGNRIQQSAYPRDKVILALEFAKFISCKYKGTSKLYSITEQGKRLYQLILGGYER